MSVLGNQVNGLIAKIKKGDQQAFAMLYEATYKHLRLVAYNYLCDKNDVEDVLIEAYFRIYKYIKSANLSKDGFNWMCKIVQNVAFDFNRQREVSVPISVMENKKLFYEIEDFALADSAFINLVKEFDTLDQQLMYLRFYEDYTYEEIAKMKNMKKATVYKRIKSLMKKIEKEVKKQSTKE